MNRLVRDTLAHFKDLNLLASLGSTSIDSELIELLLKVCDVSLFVLELRLELIKSRSELFVAVKILGNLGA